LVEVSDEVSALFASVSYDKHLEATVDGDGLESADASGLSEVHTKKICDQVDFACELKTIPPYCETP
jgi:hypothetical protein